MTVQLLPVSRSTESPADLASAVDIDLYRGKHDLGKRLVVVAAYRTGSVWTPFPWKWFSADENSVFLEVPQGTDLHEVLIIA
ncbi:hypothetical protein [Actinoplanes sp. NPDC026619]|uniref:hypothetical protein n=1 Tax=Actinoplanes sp. NPDC026619 TaxID=3155798 RepID=UPI00340ACD6E